MKQLKAMAKKARQEIEYFRTCQSQHQDIVQPSAVDLFEAHSSQGINFSNYDDIKVDVRHPENKEIQPLQDFVELQIGKQLRSNIDRMHYEVPTPIQKYAIPASLESDLMCCAQTGSGKTFAFLLPVISKLSNLPVSADEKSSAASPICIILAPTRELAVQIHLEAQKLSYNMPNVVPVSVYGGTNARPQLRELAVASSSPSHLIVIATPGRLTDFVDRHIVNLQSTKFLILDEGDRMLDMGFEPQVRKLVKFMTPKQNRQTMLFSATFPDAIQKLAAEFLNAYVWIAVGRVGSSTDSITQKLIKATPEKRHKLKLVVECIKEGPDGRTLIFVRKQTTATWLKRMLNQGGPSDGNPSERFKPYNAVVTHGGRSQFQREAALEAFRSGKSKILVATHVAARGLDINGIEHVINMDLPSSKDEFDVYVHRIGRTGRKGHLGTATSLFVPGDDPKTGNGRIAGVLVQQLKEAKQVVPGWLDSLVAGDGGGVPSKRKPQMDVRRTSNGNQKRQTTEDGLTSGRGGRGRNKGSVGGRG